MGIRTGDKGTVVGLWIVRLMPMTLKLIGD